MAKNQVACLIASSSQGRKKSISVKHLACSTLTIIKKYYLIKKLTTYCGIYAKRR